eukprot:COSAG02_NODE_5533_length_4250_cov_2.274633_3_plen_45_part_00
MPRTEGFLAVVRPLPEKLHLIKESLLSKEEFEVLRNVTVCNNDL